MIAPMHRRERKENPQASDRYGHIGFTRFVQYVAYFKGWAVALTAALVGVILTGLVLAVAVVGAITAIYLGQDLKPGRLAVGAVIAFVTSLLAGEILVRRKPWRGALSIAATAGSNRRPGTLGLSYRVSGAEPYRIRHALLSGGFFHVNENAVPQGTPDGTVQVEALIRLEGDVTEEEARRRIETTLDHLGAIYHNIGSSQSY